MNLDEVPIKFRESHSPRHALGVFAAERNSAPSAQLRLVTSGYVRRPNQT